MTQFEDNLSELFRVQRDERAPSDRNQISRVMNSNWEQNLPNCGLCQIGFDVFERRHHCRICGKCVCQKCSPSQITTDGHTGLQRACTPCVSYLWQHGEMSDALKSSYGIDRLETELENDIKT